MTIPNQKKQPYGCFFLIYSFVTARIIPLQNTIRHGRSGGVLSYPQHGLRYFRYNIYEAGPNIKYKQEPFYPKSKKGIRSKPSETLVVVVGALHVPMKSGWIIRFAHEISPSGFSSNQGPSRLHSDTLNQRVTNLFSGTADQCFDHNPAFP